MPASFETRFANLNFDYNQTKRGRRIAANVAELPELLRGRSERVNKGYLPLIIAATFLGKFSCQFEQRLGFVEIDAG